MIEGMPGLNPLPDLSTSLEHDVKSLPACASGKTTYASAGKLIMVM
jgi:hypothetical protein